jgi:transcriptional regulator with XRE-family HTH domain
MHNLLADGQLTVNSPKQIGRTPSLFGGTVGVVTDEDVLDVLRSWAYLRLKKSGWSQARFCKETGIKTADFSRALRADGKTVTWRMLRLISETVGPTLDVIVSELGEMLATAAHRTKIGRPAVPEDQLWHDETDEPEERAAAQWPMFEGERERKHVQSRLPGGDALPATKRTSRPPKKAG